MKRRSFLATGAVAPAALAAPALSQGLIEWRCPTAFPANSPGVGHAAQDFVRRVEALSDGRLRLRLFSAGELVPAFAVEDAVQNGTAEIGHTTPFFAAGKNSAVHSFTTVPFGLTWAETIGWMAHGGGQALMDEVYAQRGLVSFHCGNSTVSAGGWFRREIRSVADLAGLNMRIASLGGEALRKLGVNAMLLPPTEIFPAFQSGAIDAAEWVGPVLDQAFGLNRIASICYAPGFHEPGGAMNVVVNRAAWDGLPPVLRQVLRNAGDAALSASVAEFEYRNARAFHDMQAEGVRFLALPPDVLEALRGAVAEVLEEQAAANPDFARCRDSHDRFLAAARDYARAFSAPSMMQRL